MARKDKLYLIRDQSAVPCDPDAGWKEGDMVPDYVTSRADAQGSAADNTTRASWNDGNITTHGHQVSFVKTLGLGVKTTVGIQAVKLRQSSSVGNQGVSACLPIFFDLWRRPAQG